MATGVFDVVLFGFRNDLARAQALEFLDGLPSSQAGPMRVDRDTAVPQRLFAALNRDPAEQLCATLEGLGAQVALIEVAGSMAGLPESAVPSYENRRPHPGIRPLTLGLVLALAATTYLWRSTEHARRVETQRPAPAVERPVAMESMPRRAPAEHESEAAVLNAEAIRLAGGGQFSDAVDHLQRALRLAPDDPVLTRNLQTVLFNWGVAGLAADQLADAGDHLLRAAQLGERVDVLNALGVTYLRQADYTRAAGTLDQALRLAPRDKGALVALAQVYLKQAKRPQALDLLQRAKEAGAGGAELDKMLQQLGREVDAEWDFVQLESRHFSVSFADAEERGVVKLVLDALEDAYDAVGVKFGVHPDEKTAAVLYTQQDFHAITQTPDWAGAAFDGRIKIPVRGLSADDTSFARTIRHEYAHSLIAQLSGGRCPVWLNEGLAVWAEEESDGERVSWAEGKIAEREPFALDALNGSFITLPADQVEVAYAESYLAVRALVDRHGARKIPALLDALNRTRSISEAFAAVYPGDWAGFQQQFLRQLNG